MAETIQPTQTTNTPYAGTGGGTAIGSLVGGLFNLIGSGINYGAQQQTNMKNEELLRESWRRDDSAMQRARRDAEAAGFSPLAALGNSLGNTNPTAMQAPNLDTLGVSNSIESGLNRYMQKKEYELNKTLIDQQIEDAKEATRGVKLDNDLKEQTFNTKVMQEVAALNELRKKNDITDAQYWAYLADMKARGMTNEFIDAMIKQKEAGYDATKQTAEGIKADKTITENINLSKEQINKIKADINKINDERNILVEQYKQWKGENGYWANQLKKIQEEVTRAKNENGNLQQNEWLPTVEIFGNKVNGRVAETASDIENYILEISALTLAQSAKKDADLKEVIMGNGFLTAIEYIFGAGSGGGLLNTISGLVTNIINKK